eukprot:346089-Chlamydomonas_euryale.AAC.1
MVRPPWQGWGWPSHPGKKVFRDSCPGTKMSAGVFDRATRACIMRDPARLAGWLAGWLAG